MKPKIVHALFSMAVVSASVAATQLAAVAAGGEQVEYRLTAWKTMHFEDSQKGATHLKVVQDLGCEAKQESHAGHIDVSYRCQNWMKMTVASHEAAHQWEKWLKAAGFETKHTH